MLAWCEVIGTSPHRSIGTVFLAPLFVFLAQWAYGQRNQGRGEKLARPVAKPELDTKLMTVLCTV